jgi:hypothetical protein
VCSLLPLVLCRGVYGCDPHRTLLPTESRGSVLPFSEEQLRSATTITDVAQTQKRHAGRNQDAYPRKTDYCCINDPNEHLRERDHQLYLLDKRTGALLALPLVVFPSRMANLLE